MGKRFWAGLIASFAVVATIAAALVFSAFGQSTRMADLGVTAVRYSDVIEAGTQVEASARVAVALAAIDSSASDRDASASSVRSGFQSFIESARDAGIEGNGGEPADPLGRFESAIREGDAVGAGSVWNEDLAPFVSSVMDQTAGRRSLALRTMETESTAAGRIAGGAAWFVALVFPALVLLGGRGAVRRRLERSHLEGELEKAKAIDESRRHMLSGLSHELRTPLTGLTGYASILREALRDVGMPDRALMEGALGAMVAES